MIENNNNYNSEKKSELKAKIEKQYLTELPDSFFYIPDSICCKITFVNLDCLLNLKRK